MSYLNLPAGVPNFSKAVFSLWFRVPKESVLAVVERTLADPADFKYMQFVLPLVTFGRPQQNKNYQPNLTDVAVYHYTPEHYVPFLSPTSYLSRPYDVDPCLIGALCHDDGTFDMTFNIQMADYGTYNSLAFMTTRADLYSPEAPPDDYSTAPGSGWGGFGAAIAKTTIADDTFYVIDTQAEVFLVETRLPESLQPDTWHHVLLSFDVSGTVSIGNPYSSSTCQLWYAIDDVDYRGALNLRPYRVDEDGLGPNIIVTKNSFDWSGPPLSLFQNHFVPDASGAYHPEPIPTAGEHFGIPAVPRYVDRIFRVEMAEFQMFTGVTLDTSITANRRAFVDEDGQPVLPDTTEDEPRTPAEQLLGKKPDILLHGSDEWIEGTNTGTLGVQLDSEGAEIELPSGQFTPTGGIEQFEPDPALKEPETA